MSQKYLQSEKEHLLNAIGTELAWGWSPAIDLCALVDKASTTATPSATTTATAKSPSSSAPKPLNFLLVGASDIRHVLLTISRMRREYPDRVVNFFMYEPNLRMHCRHLFFLQFLLENLSLAELEDRVSMFLELFGNTKIRDITAVFMKATAQKVLRLIGYEEGPLARHVTFIHMKSKEKDFVEDQLQFWAKNDAKSRFNIEEQWEHRLRNELAERYDNSSNVIDWDFSFGLGELTNLLKFPEYREFRQKGMAFDYGHINPRKGFTYDYNCANKTLAHYNANTKTGTYVGDVKIGPFFALGIDTESTPMKQRGPDHAMKYGNGVVAMHNVRAWLYELISERQWPWEDHKFAWDDPKNYNHLPPGTPSDLEFTPKLPKANFHFVGLDLDRFFLRLKESGIPTPSDPLAGLDDSGSSDEDEEEDEEEIQFDAVFVGANSTQFMNEAFFKSLKPDATIVCENIKFFVDAKDEARQAFVGKIAAIGKPHGFIVDEELEDYLHRNQPEPRRFEVEPTAGQRKAMLRYKSHHSVVLAPATAIEKRRQMKGASAAAAKDDDDGEAMVAVGKGRRGAKDEPSKVEEIEE